MEDTKLEFRKLTKHDVPQMRQLSEFVRTNIRPDFLTAYRNEDLDTIYNEKLHSHFVATYGEEIAGILRYINNQDLLEFDKGVLKIKDSQKLCKLGGAVVLPKFRDQDIMQKLHNMAFDVALENELNLALARVHPENINAINALIHSSFSITATENNEKKMPRHFLTKPFDYAVEK